MLFSTGRFPASRIRAVMLTTAKTEAAFDPEALRTLVFANPAGSHTPGRPT